jgi:uncharacterized protein YbcV (DUF1398 family)
MSKAVDKLMEAMKLAETNRPRVGGFPYLAEVLRKAGVTTNVCNGEEYIEAYPAVTVA